MNLQFIKWARKVAKMENLHNTFKRHNVESSIENKKPSFQHFLCVKDILQICFACLCLKTFVHYKFEYIKRTFFSYASSDCIYTYITKH